ncbi:MAG: histone deacetylase [Pseudomonadota bacterium]
MKILNDPAYNFDLGLLAVLHPFEGRRFERIGRGLRDFSRIEVVSPESPISQTEVDNFLTVEMQYAVKDKDRLLTALEVPKLPFVGYDFIESTVLTPMRWGVAGTILGAKIALDERSIVWNLAGGYHHAGPAQIEGFCVYNDIGICVQNLIESGTLSASDRILIVDTDAHHGNGNAATFMEASNVSLLDVYNSRIYPLSTNTRDRIDFPVALPPGADGVFYLDRFLPTLEQLDGSYALAFVVAGTDVLKADKLGGFSLTNTDVVERDAATVRFLLDREVPAIFLGGGGYSKASIEASIASISTCAELIG